MQISGLNESECLHVNQEPEVILCIDHGSLWLCLFVCLFLTKNVSEMMVKWQGGDSQEIINNTYWSLDI